MKKMMVIGLAVVAVFTAACQMTGRAKAESAAAKPLRVGVYDSRCIAVAYVHSEFSKNDMQKLFDAVHKAEKEGDVEAAKQSRGIAEYMQKKRHAQGFGTASVQELLEPIKKQLPKLAEQTGVDMIVSKWQIDYQVEDAQFVDVTDAIVNLYLPNEKTIKIVESMKNVKPISEKEAVEIDD